MKYSLLLVALGWIPVLGLYVSLGYKLSDDEVEEHLPKGLSRAVYTYFAPDMARKVAALSFHQSKHPEINVLGFSAAGFYDPVMRRISMAASENDDPMLVHEILHHVWFQRLVPDQDQFLRDYEQMLVDERYPNLGKYISSRWEHVSGNGEPSVLKETELYSYIGQFAVWQKEFADDFGRGLPDYLARHYRGVLQEDFLLDYRMYTDTKQTIAWANINMFYCFDGQQYLVGDHVAALDALIRLGGVISWDIALHRWVVKRVGTTKAIGPLERAVPAGTLPTQVHVEIISPGSSADLVFYSREENGYKELGRAPYLSSADANWNWYRVDWHMLSQIRSAYVQRHCYIVQTFAPPMVAKQDR